MCQNCIITRLSSKKLDKSVFKFWRLCWLVTMTLDHGYLRLNNLLKSINFSANSWVIVTTLVTFVMQYYASFTFMLDQVTLGEWNLENSSEVSPDKPQFFAIFCQFFCQVVTPYTFEIVLDLTPDVQYLLTFIIIKYCPALVKNI